MPSRYPGRVAVAARSRAARFFIPRSHRLFVSFSDRAAADAAVGTLPPGIAGDAWFFEGQSGVDELEPDRQRGRSRVFSFVFSHNVEFLHSLARLVQDGEVVVALPAPNLRAAEELGPRLVEHGAQVLAYTAHWNFVPV